MDEDTVQALKAEHGFAEWADRNTLPEGLFFRNFFLSESLLEGWRLLRATPIRMPGAPPLVQSLWTPEAGPAEAVLRLDVYECDSRRTAHELLIRLVGQFQAAPVNRRDELGVGDVNFTPLGDGGIVFSRGNLVLSLGRAGTAPVPVLEVARQLDRTLTERPVPPGAAARRARAAGRVRLARQGGRRVLEMESPEAESQSYKIFTPGGDVRAEGDRLVYEPVREGAEVDREGTEEIEVFSIDPQGNADRQTVLPPGSE